MFRNRLPAITAGVLLLLSACTVTLVQPYDEELYNDTEALFKKGSAMIDEGAEVSPGTDDEREAIKQRATDADLLTQHPAHAAQFARRYNDLLTDTDVLLLRAISNSRDINSIGEKIQKKIEKLIDEAIPSNCPEADQEFADMTSSLTVRQYIDLRCLLFKWKEQHSDAALTRDTQILKRVNWELRRSTLFSAVLAIQAAEAAKKK